MKLSLISFYGQWQKQYIFKCNAASLEDFKLIFSLWTIALCIAGSYEFFVVVLYGVNDC
jgi:hypothetical protein